MTRAQALGGLALIWALIFLPALGSTQLKGEEGRRIFPAMHMLESGDWIVPYVAGAPYLRKPPLLNWLIAGSFKLTGAQNEWSARLPSVLAMLALAMGVFAFTKSWLGVETAFLAGVISITNAGLVEKGRLAEIEAVYVALSGLGMAAWLGWHEARRSRWLVWTVPWVFLALAALCKGPVHLFFFYALVLGVLIAEGRLREFRQLPHAVGLVIMLTIFAAWAVPYFRATEHLNAAGVWTSQLTEHTGGGDFDAKSWVLNFPRMLSNFLPWLLFAPLWWMGEGADARVQKGLRWAVLVSVPGLMLIPGTLPRYTLPMMAVVAVLTALSLRDAHVRGAAGSFFMRWPPVRLGMAVGLIIGSGIVLYALFAVPQINRHADSRAFGSRINAQLPPAAPLLVFDVGYQPAAFYLRPPLRYVADDRDLPDDAPWVLAREEARDRFVAKWERVTVHDEVRDPLREKKKLILVSLEHRRE